MRYIHAAGDAFQRSGALMSDETMPGIHHGQLSSWILMGPPKYFEQYSLGNLETGRLSCSIDTYEPNGGSRTHTHDDLEQGYYVVSGQVSMEIGGEKATVGPGGGAYIPAGVEHGFENAGEENLTVVVMNVFPPSQ